MAEKKLNRCVIVCACPNTSPDFVKQNILNTDYVIAADGGAEILLQAGIIPNLFVGDFDSCKSGIPESCEVIKLNTHKDDSDSMHCAETAVKRGFKEAVLLGALGGRLDHTLANLCVLNYLDESGVSSVIKDEGQDVYVLSRGEHNFKGYKGKTFSVFPFGCDKTVLSIIGDTEYPAANLALSAFATVGLSNIFKSDDVKLCIKEGKAAVFINRKTV